MSNITGSNGNDVLVGTAHADRISPLLGNDIVEGRGGLDTLVLDYRSIATSEIYAGIYAPSAPFQSSVSVDAGNWVLFTGIEKIELTLGGSDDHLFLTGDGVTSGVMLDFDAGAGSDTLSADFSPFGSIIFKVGANGKAKLAGSTFTGFEHFDLNLSDGNDIVILGAGNDVVFANGGNDILDGGAGDDILWGGTGANIIKGGSGDDSIVTSGSGIVDGGSGLDAWQGDYRFETQDLTLTYNGASGSLSNGTLLNRVESIAFFGGSGDDTAFISGTGILPSGAVSTILSGGEGHDVLNIDRSEDGANPDFQISISEVGPLGGGTSDGVSFNGFEAVNIEGADGDVANFNLFVEQDISIAVAADGTLTSNIGVTLSNFDSFILQLGEGNDNVTGGANSDLIYGMGGDDTISGGGGGDGLVGGEGADLFVFASLSDLVSADSVDWIQDFSSGQGDKIDFSALVPGEFSYIGEDAFSGGGSAELRVEGGDGFYSVHGDLNGDGAGDFFMLVSSDQPLSQTDFFL